MVNKNINWGAIHGAISHFDLDDLKHLSDLVESEINRKRE